MAFFLRVFIAGFAAGIFLGSLLFPLQTWSKPCFPDGKNRVFSGVVDDFPEESETVTRFTLRTASHRFLILTSPFVDISYGDRFRVEGKSVSLRENLKPFFAVSEICAQFAFPLLTFMEHGKGDSLRAFLFGIRKTFLDEIQKIFHEPQATLAASLLLGHQGKGSYEEDFRKAGLSHLTALSGFNITILITFIAGLFRYFPSHLRGSLSALLIMLFVILTGAEPSAVRAGIMGILFIFAKIAGRSYAQFHTLLLAAFFMVLWNPIVLPYDVGFQLSFLATLGLIIFSKPLLNLFDRLAALKIGTHKTQSFACSRSAFGLADRLAALKIRLPDWLREYLAVSLAAQSFTLPFVIWKFQTFNPFILISNILITPMVPFTMGLTFATTFLHKFLNEIGLGFLGFLPGWYANITLRWMMGVARVFSRFAIIFEIGSRLDSNTPAEVQVSDSSGPL